MKHFTVVYKIISPEKIEPHCEKLCMKIDTLGRCIKGYIIYLCISMRKMYRIQLNANFDIPNFKVGLLQSINKYVLKILCCRLKLIKYWHYPMN